jgi:hypothetical protein
MSPNPVESGSDIIINIIAPCDLSIMDEPNIDDIPTNKSANISSNKRAYLLDIDGFVAIYDLKGALKKKIEFSNYGELNVELNGLEKGLHIVEIFDGVNLQRQKLLIQD